MKIGIDLDGVIFDSERIIRVCAELYDVSELHQNNVIDNREVKFQDRYNWSQDIKNDFISKYLTYSIEEAKLIPGAKEVTKILKKEGHESIVISTRGNPHKEQIEITEDVLKKNNMYIFDKYLLGIENKRKVCLDEKIDLMIEDSNINCKEISEARIKTLYFKDAPNFEMQDNEFLKTVYNWGEVYRYIKEVENEYRNSKF